MIVADLTVTRCAECGCNFGVPGDFLECRRGDKRDFYCPNGHVMSYRESVADQLRRERDRLTQRLAEKDDEIARQRSIRETAERQAAAARGQVTKIKNRVGHGVCPCCNRTFENLARHMASKHADYAIAAE